MDHLSGPAPAVLPAASGRATAAALARVVGALAVLATGADHLEEYAGNQFSTVPTIGTLFVLNFVGATIIGIGLLAPLGRIAGRLAAPLRAMLCLGGIGLAASSLIGLWISEISSLFGFTEHGYRPAIVAAIAAEAVAIIALSAYLVLAGFRPARTRRIGAAGTAR